jgi:hypothetical protein
MLALLLSLLLAHSAPSVAPLPPVPAPLVGQVVPLDFGAQIAAVHPSPWMPDNCQWLPGDTWILYDAAGCGVRETEFTVWCPSATGPCIAVFWAPLPPPFIAVERTFTRETCDGWGLVSYVYSSGYYHVCGYDSVEDVYY